MYARKSEIKLFASYTLITVFKVDRLQIGLWFFSLFQVKAVCADMITKDCAAIITITPYYSGAAPVRLENCTKLNIRYKQKG